LKKEHGTNAEARAPQGMFYGHHVVTTMMVMMMADDGTMAQHASVSIEL
jgi:hypothetical protein